MDNITNENHLVIEDAKKIVKMLEGKTHDNAEKALRFALGLISEQAVINPSQGEVNYEDEK